MMIIKKKSFGGSLPILRPISKIFFKLFRENDSITSSKLNEREKSDDICKGAEV